MFKQILYIFHILKKLNLNFSKLVIFISVSFCFYYYFFSHHILLFFSLIKLIFCGLPHLGGKSCAFLKKAQTFLM